MQTKSKAPCDALALDYYFSYSFRSLYTAHGNKSVTLRHWQWMHCSHFSWHYTYFSIHGRHARTRPICCHTHTKINAVKIVLFIVCLLLHFTGFQFLFRFGFERVTERLPFLPSLRVLIRRCQNDYYFHSTRLFRIIEPHTNRTYLPLPLITIIIIINNAWNVLFTVFALGRHRRRRRGERKVGYCWRLHVIGVGKSNLILALWVGHGTFFCYCTTIRRSCFVPSNAHWRCLFYTLQHSERELTGWLAAVMCCPVKRLQNELNGIYTLANCLRSPQIGQIERRFIDLFFNKSIFTEKTDSNKFKWLLSFINRGSLCVCVYASIRFVAASLFNVERGLSSFPWWMQWIHFRRLHDMSSFHSGTWSVRLWRISEFPYEIWWFYGKLLWWGYVALLFPTSPLRFISCKVRN